MASASKSRSEGSVLFSFDIYFEELPRVGQPSTILVRASDSWNLADSIDFEARIELPPGWVLLAGEPTQRVRTKTGRTLNWSVTARPTHRGRFAIRGSLRIDRGRYGADEAEYIESVELAADTALVSQTQPTRLESIRGGQRYRYAGGFLVPIDAQESFTQNDIEQRAQVVSQSDARCDACPADHPEALRWLVIVDAGGRIKSARLLDGEIDPNSAAATAARIALDSWKFSPGRMKGQSVPDWLVVVVPLSK